MDYDFHYYEVLGNQDQTEGKGPMVIKRRCQTEEAAVTWAHSDEGRDECGVMGHGFGEVVFIGLQRLDGGSVNVERTKVWGYRQDWKREWNYGYIDNRDAPTNDPDYKDYLRLKAKFEGK